MIRLFDRAAAQYCGAVGVFGAKLQWALPQCNTIGRILATN
jgi:hypothetical protein